jgi:hypothetical protein
VTTAGAVLVIGVFGMRSVYRTCLALIPVARVLVVGMALVHVVRVSFVRGEGVSAAGRMHVGVTWVFHVCSRHFDVFSFE